MTEKIDSYTFTELFTKFYTRFVYFAKSYVHDIDVAEDFVTDAYMKYWENKDKLLSDSNVSAYMLTIIKNKCLNHLEHLKLKNKVLDEMRDVSEWDLDNRIKTLSACDPEKLFSDEIQKIVKDTLAGLPEKTAQIFMLSRDNNLSHKEIAEIMGMTTKGVEFHITKALSALRVNLQDYYPLVLLFFF